METTSDEAKKIAEEISPIFMIFVKKYEEDKYPPKIYEVAKMDYSERRKDNLQVSASIKWKYGKTNSSGISLAHNNIIAEIQKYWPKYVDENCCNSAKGTFNWWSRAFNRKTTYITTAYITHLIHHADQVPMIDQHNYRAMCELIKKIKPSFKAKRVPSNWSDIVTLGNFMNAIQKHLGGRTIGEIDRFLMMYGKSLKKRRAKRPKKSNTL